MLEAAANHETMLLRSPLQPSPEKNDEVSAVRMAVDAVQPSTDPFVQPAKVQMQTHLRHISLTFRVRPDSNDYVHENVLHGPFPAEPTERMISKAARFLRYVASEQPPASTTPFIHKEEAETAIATLREVESTTKKNIVADPFKAYETYSMRLQQHGQKAIFPEFSTTVALLRLQLLSGQEVKDACSTSSFMTAWREDVLGEVAEALEQEQYGTSILAIESALEFLDIVSRGTHEESPGLYHSDRYEYYFHYLLHTTDHVLFPTAASLGATDLLKMRGVPIGMVGVNVQDAWVDGFMQTPYEFFIMTLIIHEECFNLCKKTQQARDKLYRNMLQKVVIL